MPLYFAYGSNMDVVAMAERCPGSRPLGPARLAGHSLLINEDGYATVVRNRAAAVHGLLYDLAFRDIPALDCYEDIARGLYSKVTQPVITSQGVRKALVYVGRSARPGKARPGYLESVVAAAEAAELPARYVSGLRALGGLAEPIAAIPSFRAIGAKPRNTP